MVVVAKKPKLDFAAELERIVTKAFSAQWDTVENDESDLYDCDDCLETFQGPVQASLSTLDSSEPVEITCTHCGSIDTGPHVNFFDSSNMIPSAFADAASG